ncbi:hypothetical protein [Microbispora sp. CA-102843]|uniref:hypothetical protein n=1 Tax=Microbispora sp. CA-102843 TaxID=3239952 RepID=UPI003D937ADC
MGGNALRAAAATYELPDELLARAMWYLCNERQIFHRYCVLRESPAFPLFFMDRCYDWQFESTGEQPIISRYNGFMEIVCRESMVERSVDPARLADELGQVTAAGGHVSLLMAYVHEDGTHYTSPWLVEAVGDGVVYCTRTGSEHNSFRRPIPYEEIAAKVALDADGFASITEVRPSPTLDRILAASPLESFRQIFDAFGLRWYDHRLHRYVTPVVVSAEAIDKLIEQWQLRTEELVASGTVKMFDQLRLNKHLQNRFQPTQQAMRFISEAPDIRAAIGPELNREAKENYARMDDALADIMKYSSLFVQRPSRSNMDLYLKYLRRLREVVADYQRMVLGIQLAIAG